METPNNHRIALMTERVADYGGQIAAVFHNHSLSAERVPAGFEGSINILDSTVTILKQALELLNQEAAGKGPKLFSDEGLKYVQVLTNECATTLAKVEPLLASACLSPKEAREKRKLEKKNTAQKGETVVNPLELKLDAKAFLETVETAKWSRISSDMEDCMERLYELQLHLALVFQVVKVGALSRDLSSGKVDIKSIVAYHDRISKTADLVGIKPPKGQSRNASHRIDSSSSDDSSSDSDSSMDLKTARRRLKNLKRRLALPPPPPPPPPPSLPAPPPNAFNSFNLDTTIIAPIAPDLLPSTAAFTVDAGALPPAYYPTSSRPISSPVQDANSSVADGTSSPSTEKEDSVTFLEEKTVKDEQTEEPKPVTLEPRLFKSNTNGLGFKFKSLFRSKQSLANEMKKALSDSESRLIAYVLRGLDVKQVPHSAFHSLESTHMRTILSQLNDDSWYKTFTSLTSTESHALEPIIRPGVGNTRDVVVLKVIEHSRLNSWFVLLKELFQQYPMPYQTGSNRVLLAIVREKLVDGKAPLGPGLKSPFHPPVLQKRSIVRPPPGLPVPIRSNSRVSDLRFPPPPSAPPGWHVTCPPLVLARGPPPPPSPPADNSPTMVDIDIEQALTVYTEYTLRQVESHNEPGPTKTWSRIQITQESNEREDIISRINKFEDAGGNIIELKLRLSEQQSTQVNRLMDELKSGERDQRFDWSWAEMSLYAHSGLIAYKDITATDHDVPFNFAPMATHIHLIAKRTLRSHCVPIQVYNQFMKPPPPPGPRPGGPGPPPGWNGGPPPIVLRPGNVHVQPGRRRTFARNRRNSYSSGSDSEYVSDSSEGEVRRRLRKYRSRKVRRNNRIRNRIPLGSDWSGSDTDTSEEEDDVIELRVELKRGEDVVKALLELWTPQTEEGSGKGKEVV